MKLESEANRSHERRKTVTRFTYGGAENIDRSEKRERESERERKAVATSVTDGVS